MIGLLAVELSKRRGAARGWLVLAVAAAVPALLTLLIGTTRASIPERVGDWGSVVTGTSGLAMPLIALSAMQLFLLPLAVAVFAGEAVAGEAGWGSLRYVLARPVSRTRVLGAKAAVAAGFSLAAVAVACASAVVSGVLAFGWRPLTVLDLQRSTAFSFATATFDPAQALGRVGLGAGIVAAGLASTFAFALLASTLTASPFGAVAAGVGFGLVSRALDNVAGLQALSPWLPVTDAGSALWVGLFSAPARLDGLGAMVLVQAAYTAAFLAAAWLRFTRADVLA